MEKLINKTRVLIWIILALVVINIATIGTIIWYLKSGEPHRSEHFRHGFGDKFERGGEQRQNKLFENLKFSSEQKEKFKQVEKEYRDNAWSRASELQHLRKNMFALLNKQNPYLIKIEQVADSIGLLHKDLKMQTADFYLKVRAICKPEQADSLARFFERIVSQEPDVPFPQHYRNMHNKERGHPFPEQDRNGCKDHNPPPPPPAN